MSLKSRLAEKTAKIAEAASKSNEQPMSPAAGPVTMPGRLGAFRIEAQRYLDQISTLQQQLDEARNSGALLPIADLHEVPGRRRQLTEEQFAELVENLRHNELTHPIRVRPRSEGGYEIIAGHNRVAAYRALGRSHIEATIRTVDDERAVESAFFSNLFQITLPDYEKFLGFSAIQQANPDRTQDELAKTSGLSKSQVSKILSFGELPEAALTLLDAHRDALGANRAYDLAGLAKEGKGARVVEAVEMIIQGKLTQAAAVEYAGGRSLEEILAPSPAAQDSAPVEKKAAPKQKKAAAPEEKFKDGKVIVCTFRESSSMVRIDFKDKEMQAACSGKIREILEQYMKEKKADGQ